MRKLLIALIVLSFLAGAVVPALAAPPRKPSADARKATAELRLALIDASWEKLPFGGDVAQTMAWVRARVEAGYGPKLKAALDDHERMRLRKELEAEVERVGASLVPFDGRRTGLETSVVAREFVDGTSESVLTFRDGEQTVYLFFTEAKLYKVARTEGASASWDERIDGWSRDFGRATRTAAVAGADPIPATAVWTGKQRRLKLFDMRRLFNGDLLVVEDIALAAEVDKRRGGKKPGVKRQVDPDLEGLLDTGEE